MKGIKFNQGRSEFRNIKLLEIHIGVGAPTLNAINTIDWKRGILNGKKRRLNFIYDVFLMRKIKCEGYSYLLSAISLSDRRLRLYPRCKEIENIMKEHTKTLN